MLYEAVDEPGISKTEIQKAYSTKMSVRAATASSKVLMARRALMARAAYKVLHWSGIEELKVRYACS